MSETKKRWIQQRRTKPKSLPAPRLLQPTRYEDLLSIGAVAAMHGCSRNTVHQSVLRGELEATPIHGEHGEPVSYAIMRGIARQWAPRPVGRPPRSQDRSTRRKR